MIVVEVQAERSVAGKEVVRAALALVVIGWLALSLRPETPRAEALLQPFQVPFHRLAMQEQIVLRELWTLVPEIAASAADGWIRPAVLEERGLAPFAPIWLATGEIAYDWRFEQQGEAVRYFGVPRSATLSGAPLPALLLTLERTVIEGDTVHETLRAMDGQHQRLDDGRLFHYALWLHTADAAPPRLPRRPELEGWRQAWQEEP
jgi:hypothetical protein